MAKAIRCPRCARENDPALAACLDCGRPLEAASPPAPATCAGCGAALAPGARFCCACGRATGAAPPARSAAPAPAPAPRAAAPRFRLTAVRIDGAPGGSLPVDAAGLVCGRAEGALRLSDDPTVSPRHARFVEAAGALVVEDLGSANGTFLRLRAPRRLGLGEEVRVGRQLLRLEAVPRPPAPAPGAARAWGSPDRGARVRLAQLLEDGGVGEVFPLREGENLVGREAGDVTFPADRYVSARHARVEVAGDEVTLADAGSSNGTFVRVAGRTALARGDQLLVGLQLLRVDAAS